MDFFVYYCCLMTFSANLCFSMLNITKAPYFLSEEDQLVEAYVGDKVRLKCQVAYLDVTGVTVLWTKDTLDNVIVSEREVIVNNGHISMPDDDYDEEHWDLDINNVEISDAGDYFCQITTVPDRLIQKSTLVVKTSPAIRIVPPGSLTYVRIGESLNLSCISDQKFFSRIEWKKSDAVLKTSPEGSNSTSIDYYLKNVSPLDDGIYQCIVSMNSSQYEEARVRVQVTYPPRIVTKSSNLAFKEGGNVMLPCDFTASPPALALWYRNGHLLPIPLTSDKRMKMVYGLIFDNSSNLYYGFSNLHINNTSFDDCGIYVCNVTNSVGGDVIPINFGAEPAIVSLKLHKKKQRLSWTIKSIEPLLSLNLHYKRVHDGLERSFSLFNDKTAERANYHFIYEAEADTNYFDSGLTYQLYLIAQNRYGYTVSDMILYGPDTKSGVSNDTINSPISNNNIVTSPGAVSSKNSAVSLASKAAFLYFIVQCRLAFTKF